MRCGETCGFVADANLLQSLYDSYVASGYPRSAEAGKQPGAQAQQQPGAQVGQQQAQPHSAGLGQHGLNAQQQPPGGFYSQMNNMGYYAPYNPYFQCESGDTPCELC